MKKIIYSFHFKTERWEIPVDIIFFNHTILSVLHVTTGFMGINFSTGKNATPRF